MEKRNEFMWKKMPVSWQKEPEFQRKIRDADQGVAIAALKLYIAICLKAEYYETERLSAGSVQLSLTVLSELVGLSRPMVIAGLELLKEWNVVLPAGGRPLIRQIVGFEKPEYWVKLPTRHLFGSKNENRIERLIELPNRRRTTLHALQLYLYLAAIRDGGSNKATVSYQRAADTLAISRNYLSEALSQLAGRLVTVRTAVEAKRVTGINFSSNEYWLRGTPQDPFRSEDIDLSFHAVAFAGEDDDDEDHEGETDEYALAPQHLKRRQPVRQTDPSSRQDSAYTFDDD